MRYVLVIAALMSGVAVGQESPADTNEIKALTVEPARELVLQDQLLFLDGLTTVTSVEVATRLAQHKGVSVFGTADPIGGEDLSAGEVRNLPAAEKSAPLKKTQPAAEKSRPPKKPQAAAEPVPGYKYRVIQGFHVLIKEVVLEHEADAGYQRKPLEVLEMELKLISGLLPSKPVAMLRTVPIWVEWKEPGYPNAVAVYHGGPTDRTHREGVIFVYEDLEQRAKSNAIEIVDMESLTEEHQPATDSGRCVLLHELSHAVHHHLIDYDNPHVKAAYQQAIERGLYRDCYASTNEREYFAELSCAYFDSLDYKPRSQDELKQYDPIGYKMMELTWGTPEQINATRDTEARRAYGKLRTQTRLMVQNGKIEEARGFLDEFLSCFRNTKTAEMAKKQFDELVAAQAKEAKAKK